MSYNDAVGAGLTDLDEQQRRWMAGEDFITTVADDPSEDEYLSNADRLRARLLRGDTGLAGLPEPKPLVRDLLDRDTVAAIFGPWGSYKSFLALDIACAVATGRTWHGRETTHGTALYVVGEGAGGYSARVDAWKAQNGVESVEDVLWLPEPVNLFDPLAAEALAELTVSEHVDFVVFDTLARCTVGADENSARDMGRVVEHLDRIRRTSGACVLVVHHTGKDAAQGLRGHSSLAGALDSVLRVEGADGYATLKVEKQKYRDSGAVLNFRLRPTCASLAVETHTGSGALDVNRLPAPIVKLLRGIAATDLGNGIASGHLQSETDLPRSSFFRHLKTASDAGLCLNVGTDKQPRYSLSTCGLQAITVPGLIPVSNGPVGPASVPGLTVSPPFRGETSETETVSTLPMDSTTRTGS